MNQQKHMNLSGFGGQGVLILVDGERLAGETMDDVDFTRLNLANVQRIEIVRGAASALYGSNAGGGVVTMIESFFPLSSRAFSTASHSSRDAAIGFSQITFFPLCREAIVISA